MPCFQPAWQDASAQIEAIYTSADRAPATWYETRRVLDKLAELAPRPDAVTCQTLAAFTRWAAAGRSVRTANKLIRHARATCGLLHRLEILPVDPFRVTRWTLRTTAKPATPHLPFDQVCSLVGFAQSAYAGAEALASKPAFHQRRIAVLVLAAAYTGARRNELLQLERDDVDTRGRTLYVRPHAKRLKTQAAEQPLPIAPGLLETVSDWLGRLAGRAVFPQATNPDRPWLTGAPGYRPNDCLAAFGREAGIQGLTFRALRHSWATHAETVWGLTAPQIQRILRHTEQLTQHHYRHADAANLAALAPKIRFGGQAT